MSLSAFIALLLVALAVLLVSSASLGAFLALWLFDRRRQRYQARLLTARLRATTRTPEPAADTPGDALFLRRLAYIERVVFEPDSVASSIDDPLLAQKLLASQVDLNKDLFGCAAALEEAEEGKRFENRPANTYARYLRPRFQERG